MCTTTTLINNTDCLLLNKLKEPYLIVCNVHFDELNEVNIIDHWSEIRTDQARGGQHDTAILRGCTNPRSVLNKAQIISNITKVQRDKYIKF